MTLLNIGCGPLAPDGWLNIDASPALRASRVPLIGRLVRIDPAAIAPNATYRDIIAGPPLEPESCELVFASHVLEHLALADARVMIQRVFTGLKRGGIFRIIVQDLDAYIAEYLRTPDASRFMEKSGIGAMRSRSGLRARLHEALSNARHQWMWTQASLRAELTPYATVVFRRGHTDVGDERFAAVEQENRHVNAICFEATKMGRGRRL